MTVQNKANRFKELILRAIISLTVKSLIIPEQICNTYIFTSLPMKMSLYYVFVQTIVRPRLIILHGPIRALSRDPLRKIVETLY